MYKILFVCEHNTARSPMAEFILNDMVKKRGIEGVFAESAGTSLSDIGYAVFPEAKKVLNEHLDIDCSEKRARLIKYEDFFKFNLIVAMDKQTVIYINKVRIDKKIRVMKDFDKSIGDIADPWFTDDYEATYRDLSKGCEGILNYLINEGIIKDGNS